jgi:hypothetical protein
MIIPDAEINQKGWELTIPTNQIADYTTFQILSVALTEDLGQPSISPTILAYTIISRSGTC